MTIELVAAGQYLDIRASSATAVSLEVPADAARVYERYLVEYSAT